jgi:hypothetical protein
MIKPDNRNFLLIVFILCCTTLFSQKLHYDVFLLGNKIGETTVERKDSAGIKHYSLRSNTDAKLLFIEKKSAMATDVVFNKEGQMFSSLFQNVKNEERSLTQTFWNNNKLFINKDGTKKEIPGTVIFSSVLLYFTEPPNLQRVFSERLGQFFEMVKQTDGTYLAALDGHEAIYTYKAGKLIALEMKGSLGSILMKLVP